MGYSPWGSHRVGQTGTEHSHIIRTTHTPCTLESFRSVVTNLLVPGTGFMEDNFSMGVWGWGRGWFRQ